MPSDKFTNAPSGSLGKIPSRTSRPYVSGPYGNKMMPLTEKEREARRQARTGTHAMSRSAGFGMDPVMGANTVMSGASNFFSVQLSTDFLQLPQSIREKREIYRHFYNADEIVAQAIDLHTELPLSKVRLAAPKPRTHPKFCDSPEDYGHYILSFFQRMVKKIKLFQKLVLVVHHLWLDGTSAVFAEDSDVQVPPDVGFEKKTFVRSVLTDAGETVEKKVFGYVEKDDREEEELSYYQKNYQGWERLIVFPIDQLKITALSFSDKLRIELIPSDRDKELIQQASLGDPIAEDMASEIPSEVREYLAQNKLIPLGTDPDEGSFCHALTMRKQADGELGQSILDRCHLPGTPVMIKRSGIVQQVFVEDLDPDTDFILSAQGVWREFEVGSRHVQEEIILLNVAKVYPPIGCTKDHKHIVLREGQLINLVAEQIQPGDYIQVAQVSLTETMPYKVDLSTFMDGISETYQARKSHAKTGLSIKVIDRTNDEFIVQYQKEETNPRLIGRVRDLNMVLEWASGLTEPVSMRSAEACKVFDLHPVTLKEIRRQLVTLGYDVRVTKSKTIIFPPNDGIRSPTSANHSKKFGRWLDLDADLGYFLGYWLGDGYITRQPGLDYGILGITYGSKVPNSQRSIQEKIKPLLDRVGVAYSDSPSGDTVSGVSGYHDAFTRWVASNFGHECEDKHLPEWIFDAPKNFISGLIRGFVDSDGDVTLKASTGVVSVRLSGTNYNLMSQFFLLCTSLGIPVSMGKPTGRRWVKMPNGSMVWAKSCYSIHFSQGPVVKAFFESGFLAKRRDPDVWGNGRSGSRHIEHEGKLFYRVADVNTARHEGAVYSLNVHEDHSFFAGLTRTSNCLRTLVFRDKLRQAQTQIADRAMTPKRVVWAEDISDADAEDLREQIDLSLVDPDYTIVANYEIHWEEMGSKDRLLDLSTEYEQTERRLRTGLGVTESLLSGETLYSGDRLKLEVINQRYLFLREVLQDYVEEYLFKPVARRKGFIEKDKWGEEVVLYPKLSFTRLPLRDSQDTYDAMLNLYQKGSLPVEVIYELFNLDPDDIKSKLLKDMFTVNDSVYNEGLRGIYGAIAEKVVNGTDVFERLVESMGLKMKPKSEGEGEDRFG